MSNVISPAISFGFSSKEFEVGADFRRLLSQAPDRGVCRGPNPCSWLTLQSITPPPPTLLPPFSPLCVTSPAVIGLKHGKLRQELSSSSRVLSRVPDGGEAGCRSGPCRQACSHRPCSSCTTFIGLEQHRRASVHQPPPRGVVVGAAYQLRPSLNIPLLSVAKKELWIW